MYKINSIIRGDFYKWIESHVNSLKLPHWCYWEYQKRAINNEKLKDFYPLSKITEKVNALTSDFQVLKFFINDSKASSLNFKNKEELIDKLNEESHFLQALTKVFRNNEEVSVIRNELNKYKIGRAHV